MYHRILIPVDGSACSEQAARYGFALAGALQVPVTLCHVVATHGLPDDDERLHIERQHGHGLLEHWQHTAEHLGLQARMHLMMSDRIAESIVEAAALEDSDLIVIGTHGRSGLGRVLLGSIAERVSRLATTPVLLVRQLEHAPETQTRFVRLLVSVDGSPISDLALEHALTLCQRLDARLELLHVVPDAPLPWVDTAGFIAPDRLASELEREGHVILEAAQAQAAAHGIEAQSTLVQARGTAIGQVIARTASQHQADLIVMGTHGRSGMERLLLGSVAGWVSHRASLPVLLVRPNARTA